MRTSRSTGSRIAGGIVVATVSALALTSCFGGPASTDVDTIDDVKTATIQIQAQGTFIEPGTIDPVEYGSRGSGFFITSDGVAVTNNHVVTGAGTLKVWVGGDQSVEFGATVLGASECLDLAVIKVDGNDFPTLGWFEGDIPQALEVFSAGFPLGDPNFTLTKGIVSKADVPQEDSWASLDHVIEHDARIRGGNSGGPLVAENGHVVGVNYAGNDELDYNFAIHRDQVLPVLDDLIAGKLVQSLGLNAQALGPNENGEPLGIWVSSVKAGSAGDKAGIEPGDVLIQLAGVTLASEGSLEEYCEVIRTQGNDATMDLTVYRPSEDAFYEGQINGDELVLTQGGGGTDPIDPVDVGSFVFVSDDSGAVQVSVPDTWSQVDGAPAYRRRRKPVLPGGGLARPRWLPRVMECPGRRGVCVAGSRRHRSGCCPGRVQRRRRGFVHARQQRRLRRRPVHRQVRLLHRLRRRRHRLRDPRRQRRQQHPLHRGVGADGVGGRPTDRARRGARHLHRRVLTARRQKARSPRGSGLLACSGYCTPRIGGVWNVPPNARSDAPTRSRYGVTPPIWNG